MRSNTIIPMVLAALIAVPVQSVLAQNTSAQGQGEVVRITDGKIAIRHGAIADLDLPAMTLNFLIDPGLAKGIAVGDKVSFTVQREGKGYRIIKISK